MISSTQQGYIYNAYKIANSATAITGFAGLDDDLKKQTTMIAFLLNKGTLAATNRVSSGDNSNVWNLNEVMALSKSWTHAKYVFNTVSYGAGAVSDGEGQIAALSLYNTDPKTLIDAAFSMKNVYRGTGTDSSPNGASLLSILNTYISTPTKFIVRDGSGNYDISVARLLEGPDGILMEASGANAKRSYDGVSLSVLLANGVLIGDIGQVIASATSATKIVFAEQNKLTIKQCEDLSSNVLGAVYTKAEICQMSHISLENKRGQFSGFAEAAATLGSGSELFALHYAPSNYVSYGVSLDELLASTEAGSKMYDSNGYETSSIDKPRLIFHSLTERIALCVAYGYDNVAIVANETKTAAYLKATENMIV